MKCRFVLFFLLVFVNTSLLLAQQKGIIYGTIMDGELDEPLSFANIGISSLGIGTTTDLDGNYRLTNIPEGSHTVTFSYLGFEDKTKDITINGGEELKIDISLTSGGVQLEEVIVKGQATGQRAAINQQINSNTIVNVVSKEKLQELPDQNAAESVGRLAGVSVYRDAGEGQQVSIRGISPRFNAITINGERLPSTEQETRSVDLSMISSDALAGIELFKAIRPDMDGDAIGGTVNFTVAKATEGLRGVARIMGGYNDLKNDFGQFRGSVSLSNRFLNNKLGVIVTGNYQKINRSNEFLNTSYEFLGNNTSTNTPIIGVASLNLGDRLEERIRAGGSLTLDYKINDNHSFLYSGNISHLNRDDQQYRRRFLVGNNELRFTARQRERSTYLLTNGLSGEHFINNLTINWRGSYATSTQKTPYSLRGQFWELAATTGAVENDRDLTTVPQVFKNDLSNTTLRDLRFTSDLVEEDRQTFQLDFKYDINLGNVINGFLKAGGKYRSVTRGRDKSERFMRPYLNGSENPAVSFPERFLKKEGGTLILLANFLGEYRNDNFFDGQYDILPGTEVSRNSVTHSLDGIDLEAFNELFGTSYSARDAVGYNGHIDLAKLNAFYEEYGDRSILNNAVDLEDYDGKENIYAAYAMAEINFRKWLMLMGGVRYENTQQEYSSRTGSPLNEDEGGTGFTELIDVSASQGYEELLPMAHMRIKPKEWVDLRLAVTKTLARPNFFNLVPWESIDNSEQIISRGKPDLKHTTAWNYDAFLSFYNKFGLFTIGGFYKALDNIDYVRTYSIIDGGPFNGYTLNEPANVEGTSTVTGVEFDLQANLRSLEGFWKGIVVGANLTLANSETFYPVFEVNTEFIPTPPFFVTTVLDTSRVGSIVGQADVIANFTLGYEVGGFSGRLSSVFQSKTLSPGNPGVGRTGSGVQRIPELDFFDDQFWRFDLALKQKLDKKGVWTAIFNMNNITNTPERALQGTANLLQEEEFFGFTAELGILFKFRK